MTAPARITPADLDSARAYARAHVADRDLWPLLDRLASEIVTLGAELDSHARDLAALRSRLARVEVPDAIGTAYDR